MFYISHETKKKKWSRAKDLRANNPGLLYHNLWVTKIIKRNNLNIDREIIRMKLQDEIYEISSSNFK
jgi:hypothetical protein